MLWLVTRCTRRPRSAFVGWTYPPLYYWIAAAVAKLTGVGIPAPAPGLAHRLARVNGDPGLDRHPRDRRSDRRSRGRGTVRRHVPDLRRLVRHWTRRLAVPGAHPARRGLGPLGTRTSRRDRARSAGVPGLLHQANRVAGVAACARLSRSHASPGRHPGAADPDRVGARLDRGARCLDQRVVRVLRRQRARPPTGGPAVVGWILGRRHPAARVAPGGPAPPRGTDTCLARSPAPRLRLAARVLRDGSGRPDRLSVGVSPAHRRIRQCAHAGLRGGRAAGRADLRCAAPGTPSPDRRPIIARGDAAGPVGPARLPPRCTDPDRRRSRRRGPTERCAARTPRTGDRPSPPLVRDPGQQGHLRASRGDRRRAALRLDARRAGTSRVACRRARRGPHSGRRARRPLGRAIPRARAEPRVPPTAQAHHRIEAVPTHRRAHRPNAALPPRPSRTSGPTPAGSRVRISASFRSTGDPRSRRCPISRALWRARVAASSRSTWRSCTGRASGFVSSERAVALTWLAHSGLRVGAVCGFCG